jgi:hypothetical protein
LGVNHPELAGSAQANSRGITTHWRAPQRQITAIAGGRGAGLQGGEVSGIRHWWPDPGGSTTYHQRSCQIKSRGGLLRVDAMANFLPPVSQRVPGWSFPDVKGMLAWFGGSAGEDFCVSKSAMPPFLQNKYLFYNSFSKWIFYFESNTSFPNWALFIF